MKEDFMKKQFQNPLKMEGKNNCNEGITNEDGPRQKGLLKIGGQTEAEKY